MGDVLEVVERPVDVIDDLEYQLVTAKRSRGGIVARSRLLGREVLTKTQFQIARDDFLMSNRQIIHGGCGIVPPALDGAIVSNEYSVLRPKSKLLLEFLGYLSHSIYFQQTCFHASVGVDVEKMIFDCERWLEFKIHLPPLQEQRRIAEILSSVDEAVAATRAVIEQTRKVKQGVLERLLTKGIGHTRFKQTEIGEIPEGWEVAQVGQFARLQPGYAFKSAEFVNSGVRLLRGSNVGVGSFDWSEGVTKHFPKERVHEFTEFLLAKNDIIIAMDRPFISTGFKVARVNQEDLPCLLLQRVGRLLPTEKCDPNWLWQIVSAGSVRMHLEKQQVGTDLPHISRSDIESCTVALPPLLEQKMIAESLERFDVQLNLLARSLSSEQRLKSALMSDLLTGRKRVPDAIPMAAE